MNVMKLYKEICSKLRYFSTQPLIHLGCALDQSAVTILYTEELVFQLSFTPLSVSR